MLPWLVSSLLVVATVYGAAIPTRSAQMSTMSGCANDCFEKFSEVLAASDLANFPTIATNIDGFCSANENLRKCGANCGPAEESAVLARIQASSFICEKKINDFHDVAECLQNSDDDESAVEDCVNSCDDEPAATAEKPPKGISLEIAQPNYTTKACTTHKCVLTCASTRLNSICPGAGSLFLDLARQQVVDGGQRLLESAAEKNQTGVEQVLITVLQNLPDVCRFVVDAEKFDETIQADQPKEVTVIGEPVQATSPVPLESAESAEASGVVVRNETAVRKQTIDLSKEEGEGEEVEEKHVESVIKPADDASPEEKHVEKETVLKTADDAASEEKHVEKETTVVKQDDDAAPQEDVDDDDDDEDDVTTTTQAALLLAPAVTSPATPFDEMATVSVNIPHVEHVHNVGRIEHENDVTEAVTTTVVEVTTTMHMNSATTTSLFSAVVLIFLALF
ncbi:unnamed protein product [Caenorhabditis auriculariae]|uniref:Chondroitin proteoglycan 4 domain-containing protein n=1 Tax=Caenorhabditis auriculariae TaxID=2777116 RepID=A0A8S1H2J1_9PELO|nr:unnamed protein product [Caenorhabditis auriculariae]